jgi:putative phosphoribosyl transferase
MEAAAMADLADRVDAGRRLAVRLEYLRGQDVVVLGLPGGGVPVAFEVAEALSAPLDVIVVRKLGVPSQPELAMGAIGEGGARVLDATVLAHAGISDEDLTAVEIREGAQLEARVLRLRRGQVPLDLTGRTALIVDEGIATGSTARVACEVARHRGAAMVVVAVPVAPAEVVRNLAEADEIVCVSIPHQFLAVGHYYSDFAPTGDEEVVVLLESASRSMHAGALANATGCDADVEIPVGAVALQGHLHLPEPGHGVVLFAHGSGSSRHSPRNRLVAEVLQRAGLGTLLLDLLSPEEELNRANVFDIELLASRLTAATRWLATWPDSASCRVGYFGASTGAGAALWAASEPASDVSAIVSRGGPRQGTSRPRQGPDAADRRWF